MTKRMAYIGVLVLVLGVLLTTCVGSAWTMELLTDEQMAAITGADCLPCLDYTTPLCSWVGCDGFHEYHVDIHADVQVHDSGTGYYWISRQQHEPCGKSTWWSDIPCDGIPDPPENFGKYYTLSGLGASCP